MDVSSSMVQTFGPSPQRLTHFAPACAALEPGWIVHVPFTLFPLWSFELKGDGRL